MGARIGREGPAVHLTPGEALQPLSMRVPNDISAAAFWMVAAAVHPDAEVHLTGVGINPTRSGIIDVLRAMGAEIDVEEERVVAGEPVADIVVRSSRLRGTVVEGDIIPRCSTRSRCSPSPPHSRKARRRYATPAELVVKESNRLATAASQLTAFGGRVTSGADSMTIDGTGGLAAATWSRSGIIGWRWRWPWQGYTMGEVRVHGAEAVAVSYPAFLGRSGEALGLRRGPMNAARFSWCCQGPRAWARTASWMSWSGAATIFHRVVTATTRGVRAGERDGVDYHFVSEPEFDRLIDGEGCSSTRPCTGTATVCRSNRCWTPSHAGKDVFVRTDVQGAAASIKRMMPEAVLVFVSPASLE